jgi:hypothetical protein
MGLADAIVRLQRGKPDRKYAMDPAHEQAIRTYLQMMTGGRNIRGLHKIAQPEINATYQDNPVIPQAFQSFVDTGHPVDLAAYLDMMAEQGHTGSAAAYGHGQKAHLQTMLDHLATMNHAVTGVGDQREPLPYVTHGFNPESMGDPEVRRLLQGYLRQPSSRTRRTTIDTLNSFHAALREFLPHLAGPVGEGVQRLREGNPLGAIPLHHAAWNPEVSERTPALADNTASTTSDILMGLGQYMAGQGQRRAGNP